MTLKRLAILLPFVAAACYNYTPVQPATAPEGLEVRARINGAAADRVAPLLGTFDTRELTGTIVENKSGAMVLEVPTGALPNTGTQIVQLRQRVPLATADFVSLETRTLDKPRTTLLTLAIIAGAALGAYGATHLSPDRTDPPIDQPSGPPLNRVPLVLFRF